ncbi:MAG: DUF3299 domain-containing protein [Rhodospirillales bacterium]|nr:DUF3299 domain-containing protein [Rhodospirillales bacterium]MBO6786075.1 DUF3299 domain-containing protein [Rhodospirillales bacterium]
MKTQAHKFVAFCLLLAAAPLCAAVPALAETPREITWDDLVPWSAPIPDPFDKLDIDDKIELGLIADIRQQIKLGYIDKTDANAEYADELTAKLTAKGLDIDALLTEDKAFRKAVAAQGREIVASLDGKLVRMPGYALPLEFTGKAVNKFLLVPYVGACIHSPPPPPNQLVVVHLDTPYKVEDIYAPVWITGELSAKPATEELSLVDGSAEIETGYTMKGMRIAPYEQ